MNNGKEFSFKIAAKSLLIDNLTMLRASVKDALMLSIKPESGISSILEKVSKRRVNTNKSGYTIVSFIVKLLYLLILVKRKISKRSSNKIQTTPIKMPIVLPFSTLLERNYVLKLSDKL